MFDYAKTDLEKQIEFAAFLELYPDCDSSNIHYFTLDIKVVFERNNINTEYRRSFEFKSISKNTAVFDSAAVVSDIASYCELTMANTDTRGAVFAFLYYGNEIIPFKIFSRKLEGLKVDFDEIFDNGFFEER